MTFEKLALALTEVKKIAESDSIASELAKKILAKDVTTHNVMEIKTLIAEYDRNR